MQLLEDNQPTAYDAAWQVLKASKSTKCDQAFSIQTKRVIALNFALTINQKRALGNFRLAVLFIDVLCNITTEYQKPVKKQNAVPL